MKKSRSNIENVVTVVKVTVTTLLLAVIVKTLRNKVNICIV
ncbi:hypothetical protein [Clostridium botulinum]|nr:hypothetical protein [Clostridium botulinum]